jgi:predicted dehydrogenase
VGARSAAAWDPGSRDRIEREQDGSMTGPLRWGVIGTGSIAATFTADLALTDSGRVIAVGSRARVSAERFAERFGIPNRHASYAGLVADPEVDVVYVATPHPMHRSAAELALRADKPVLVEKPFTMDAAEARELVALARERGLFLMEAMWMRFLPHIAEVRRLLAEGALGEIVAVSADHGQWFEPRREFRLFAPELGGGALLDLGVYPVSFASMVLGAPERIVSLTTPAFTGVDAQTSILLGYRGGAQAILSATLSAKSPTRAAIVGSQARIEIDGDFYTPTSFTLITRAERRTRFAFAHEGRGLRHQADEVARCLAEGLVESPLMGLDETISIMETMDAVRAQAS